ncbi:MAG TPA: DUF2190 family protein [Candidatus Contendobacter sp.]|nr:DUF2190 family protein [Candidatus Contendobacter sp.]
MTMQAFPILTLSVVATGTIANSRFVTAAGAQAGADANTLGVARSDAVFGDRISVDVLGTAIVEAGAAFAAGATLKSDASGRGITWATSGAKVAQALQAATAVGQFVEVLLIPNVA